MFGRIAGNRSLTAALLAARLWGQLAAAPPHHDASMAPSALPAPAHAVLTAAGSASGHRHLVELTRRPASPPRRGAHLLVTAAPRPAVAGGPPPDAPRPPLPHA